MAELDYAFVIKAYHSLKPLEKEIINIFAVYGGPLSIDNLIDVLFFLNVRPPSKRKRFGFTAMDRAIESLTDRGLLEPSFWRSNSAKINPDPYVINYVAIQLEKQGLVEKYYTALRSADLLSNMFHIQTISRARHKHFTQFFPVYARLAILLNNYNVIYKLHQKIKYEDPLDALIGVTMNEFLIASDGEPDWILTRDNKFVAMFISAEMLDDLCMLQVDKRFYQKLQELNTEPIDLSRGLTLTDTILICARIFTDLMQYHLDKVRDDLQQFGRFFKKNSLDILALKAIYYYYSGDAKKADKLIEQFIKSFKGIKTDIPLYVHLYLVLMIMIKFSFGRKMDLQRIKVLLNLIFRNTLTTAPEPYRLFYRIATALCDYLLKKNLDTTFFSEAINDFERILPASATLFSAILLYWFGQGERVMRSQTFQQLQRACQSAPFQLLQMELDALVQKMRHSVQKQPEDNQISVQLKRPFVDAFEPFPLWQFALSELEKSLQVDKKEEPDKRLIWVIENFDLGEVVLKEQKMTARGDWSPGRTIDPEKILYNESESATTQDLYIATAYMHGHYASSRSKAFLKILEAMEGHPLVFVNMPGGRRHVRVVRGAPELHVIKNQDNTYQLQFYPHYFELGAKKAAYLDNDTLYIYELSPVYRKLVELSALATSIPASEEQRLASLMDKLSESIVVQSDCNVNVDNCEYVEPEKKLVARLIPRGEDSLLLKFFARPLGVEGPMFLPGQGLTYVVTNLNGRKVYTVRNLEEERNLMARIIAACPVLEEQDGQLSWEITGTEQILMLLGNLYDLKDIVLMEWPEGERYRPAGQIGSRSLRLKLKKAADWFELSGDVVINDDLVMELQELLRAVRSSKYNFVMLDEKQFLILTRDLKKRLAMLDQLTDERGDKKILHPLALPAIEDVLSEAGAVEQDESTQSYIKRLEQINTQQVVIPEHLDSILRPYQKEGVQWLARLQQWGVGACLADDMGLGKTIQTLTVLLLSASAGPSLVVAPTSVCFNWLEEIKRFAPELNPLLLAEIRARVKAVKNLKANDVLICSYGLLQRDDVSRLLQKRKWNVVILDEAQHIKNPNTKRARAATKLDADFKIVTTGTPIENHLTDLWSIFRFINPGLLGGLKSFNARFAGPIEKYRDEYAADALKKLIHPFILRRTKEQVLKDLPPRTEIVLKIEMSEKEIAFYEALRQEALSEIASMHGPVQQNRMHIFALLTKLRRACCNPRLVEPEVKIPSSKLDALEEMLDELRANQHRVLVFSQFTGHLKLIREFLEQKGIAYQYLDGSTPPKKRQEAVEAFQAGKGDVFLISLKAGGTGLNLTAADYVIHMDPWWNPAVEDQASDRAHRIGQDKPVTIYRLVARGTIEEKIVELHNQKKDLAQKFLQGSELSSKLEIEDVIALLKEGTQIR